MFSKSALVLTTAAAIALTSFDLHPARAAPESGQAIAKQNGADEFSAQHKRRRGRGVYPGVPLAAFGAVVGTIAGIAAAERRREYDERPYAYGTPYGYAPQVCAPQVCARQVYEQPYGYVQPYGYPPQAYRHHPDVFGHPRGGYGQRGDGAPLPGQSPTGAGGI